MRNYFLYKIERLAGIYERKFGYKPTNPLTAGEKIKGGRKYNAG